jgi:DNA helicase-2/ATP-dependent DNA helicase PcrA
MDKLHLEELNKHQLEAVKHFRGPCMVYAGPGSGKTTVIIHRVGYLISNYKVEPNRILVISFTKSAVEEMKLRFESGYGWLLDRGKNVNFGTFHSIFFRILRSYYRYDLGNILNESDKHNVIKNIIKSLGVGNYSDDEFIRDIILDMGLYKSNILDRKRFISGSMPKDDFDRVLSLYEDYKYEHNKIDFDDMLTGCYELLTGEPVVLQGVRNTYEYILIDEFQDINSIQFEIIKLLSNPNENLFVVGDDDQSIYGFRGANPNFILEFDKIYKNAKKIVLNLNYRSQENIIKTANRLISNNDFRVKKTMLPIKEPGVEIQILRPENRELENKDVSVFIYFIEF